MTRTASRLFLFLLAVALPPLVAFAVADALAADLLARIGRGTALIVASGFTVLWAAVVAVVAARAFSAETRRMVELAERGSSAAAEDEVDAARRRLSSALDERNRQIAELAAQSRQAPIAADAPSVARSMVEAARSITGDPTWSLAVTRSADQEALPVGVYGADGSPSAIDEVHRWASTLDPASSDPPGVQYANGPWGAFVVVDVARSDEVHAALISPWEGRTAPSRAELDLLVLAGQHAGMAIEHALLYGRVREQAAELDRLAQLQADFLRGVSHDLQTPLTSIRALAQEVQEAEGMPAAALSDLDAIAHQADRLRRMVAQLLAMSRLEAGALTPRSDVFRVEPLIERTWSALRADRPFELATHGDPHLAVGDPDRFEQALWALLDNAVKYSLPGTPVEVTVMPQAPSRLAVTVRDHGIGMSEDTLHHAFDQFFRSADAREVAPDGSGIGLYTARGLVRVMGGDLTARSQRGSGARMTLTLPAEAAGAVEVR